MQPGREFVGSGMVIMYDEKKKLRRNKQKGSTQLFFHFLVSSVVSQRSHALPVRTVFLFSDTFLLTKYIASSGVYHLKFLIYLNPSVHVEHNPYVKGGSLILPNLIHRAFAVSSRLW